MSAAWDPSTPIYQQVKDQTASLILQGQLAEGELLPSVRQVAIDLQINPLTVSKAYQGLVDDGVVAVERGIGMRIKAGARGQLIDHQRRQFLNKEWPDFLAKMHQLGLSLEDLPMSDTKVKRA